MHEQGAVKQAKGEDNTGNKVLLAAIVVSKLAIITPRLNVRFVLKYMISDQCPPIRCETLNIKTTLAKGTWLDENLSLL